MDILPDITLHKKIANLRAKCADLKADNKYMKAIIIQLCKKYNLDHNELLYRRSDDSSDSSSSDTSKSVSESDDNQNTYYPLKDSCDTAEPFSTYNPFSGNNAKYIDGIISTLFSNSEIINNIQAKSDHINPFNSYDQPHTSDSIDSTDSSDSSDSDSTESTDSEYTDSSDSTDTDSTDSDNLGQYEQILDQNQIANVSDLVFSNDIIGSIHLL